MTAELCGDAAVLGAPLCEREREVERERVVGAKRVTRSGGDRERQRDYGRGEAVAREICSREGESEGREPSSEGESEC